MLKSYIFKSVLIICVGPSDVISFFSKF